MSLRDEYDPTISSTVKARLEDLERQLDEALERIRLLEDRISKLEKA
jgi:rRNA-processing protein FCF1